MSADITSEKNLQALKDLTGEVLKTDNIESRLYFLRILNEGFRTKIIKAGLNERGVDLCALNFVQDTGFSKDTPVSEFTTLGRPNSNDVKSKSRELVLFKVSRNGQLTVIESSTSEI